MGNCVHNVHYTTIIMVTLVNLFNWKWNDLNDLPTQYLMHSNNFLMFTFQLDSLSCLGFFPILVIGKNCKGIIVAEVKYSLDFKLPEDLEDKLKKVFENILRG